MSVISSPINQFFKKGHEWPHRFLLRNGKDWCRILDLQIKAESKGLSIFMKLPFEGLFLSQKPTKKLTLPKTGLINVHFTKDILGKSTHFNPYISWHGSGKVHANAFTDNKLAKDILMQDSNAVSLNNIKKSPHIILTAALPINSLSYYSTKPPPLQFNGNYLEISDNPYLKNKLDAVGPLNIVFDRSCLKPSYIVIDVIVHDRKTNIDLENNHPYPQNAEMFFVHLPIKITPNNPILPAVSLFFYQPIGKFTKIIQKERITFWGRSKEQKEDILFQAIKI